MHALRLFTLTLTLSLMGCASAPYGAGNRADRYFSDSWLRTKIVRTYTLNEYLQPAKISVDVQNGVATLTGSVDNDIQRNLAGEIAREIEGVSAVNNWLTVNRKLQQRLPAGSFICYLNEPHALA